MSKTIDTLTVDVKANLTVDDDTANTILCLLELYCRNKNMEIDKYYDKDNQICLSFKKLKDLNLKGGTDES